MRSSLVPLALLALALLTACQKEKPSESAAAGSATTAVAPTAAVAQATSQAAATTAAALGAAPAAENIPVAADFEDEAEKSITKANYRAELDSLEAELK